jgi:hypothetical protein
MEFLVFFLPKQESPPTDYILSCGAAPTAGAGKISNILPISNICPIGNIFPIGNI